MASRMIKAAADIVAVDDIVRLLKRGDKWHLSQIPEVQGAFVAINPENGGIEALVGGFDFGQSRFNRATQGWRQSGSTIKPFIYAQALERGYTPNSLVEDEPLIFPNWEPQNSDGKFMGPISLRRALYLSRNLVSIRLLQDMGIESSRTYMARFGMDRGRMPRDLTLALGSADVVPLQMATAYAAIANGGLRIQPYFIEKLKIEKEISFLRPSPSASVVLVNNRCRQRRLRSVAKNLLTKRRRPKRQRHYRRHRLYRTILLPCASSSQKRLGIPTLFCKK